MTSLLWDQAGQRTYESGLDRGVLYLSDGSGVSWNGLISIDEDAGDDSSEGRYFDGVKYYDDPTFGDYSATLVAFTYPDEFLEYEGIEEIGTGLFIEGQTEKLFGLSYRTAIGNDVDGIDHGYKVHIVYNLTASLDETEYETLGDEANPIPFSWKISAVPSGVDGHRPTAHVVFDSRLINKNILVALENILYGSNGHSNSITQLDGGTASFTGTGTIDGGTALSSGSDILDGSIQNDSVPGTDPHLPSLSELMDFVLFWAPKTIVPNTVTGLSQLTTGSGDLTQINVDGIYAALPTTRLVETATPGFYHYV